MPEKYHFNTKPIPPRRPRIGKYGVVDWREDCCRCHNCVKKACIYDRYRDEMDYLRNLNEVDALFFDCMGCFSCVQECTKGLLSMSVNPVFMRMGNEYWRPEIIQTTMLQAETAKIPVSGAGYGGKFSGDGFDGMWTDMSEIVRPTRDGIHGREYISTSVDLGRKPRYLSFQEDMSPYGVPHLISLPLPMILDIIPIRHGLATMDRIRLATAQRTGLMALIDTRSWPIPDVDIEGVAEHLAFYVGADQALPAAQDLQKTQLIEVADHARVIEQIAQIKTLHPEIVVSVRVQLNASGPTRVRELAAHEAVEVIHFCADSNGREIDVDSARHLKALIRQIHLSLIEDGIRDDITLIASGGIALPEHMAKAMLCGADLITVDLPLLVALECDLCGRCEFGKRCHAKIPEVDFDYGVGRMTNLIGAWHGQLIEVMGAMGIREARRLRGDVGRAMFFEELEEQNFGPLFGTGSLSENSVVGPRASGFMSGKDGEAGDTGSIVDAAGRSPGMKQAARSQIEFSDRLHTSKLKQLLPEKTYETRPAQFQMQRDIRPVPRRFRNSIPKYRVNRSDDCVACGKCASLCPQGVHECRPGYKYMPAPKCELCIGTACEGKAHYCVDACPVGALTVVENKALQALGDYRWTSDLLLATWKMSETGEPPAPEFKLNYEVGASEGGFDRLRFKYPDAPAAVNESEIDLTVKLNRRDDGRADIRIDVPWYGGGMSFGSVSNTTQLAKARAAVAFNTFTCSGEGGYMERLRPYDDHMITQVATGLFGVREETIQRVPIVEFKYAQGAKPGLGGHLLGDKNTPSVARMREAVLGISLFSPFPFHSVYSIEDHQKHMDWIKHVNRRALVSAKVSTPNDVDMVAVGSYSAGAHIVHLDGGYGGTGAAPDIAKKNIAMPIEYAIPKVHGFLQAEGARDKITLVASGGVRSAYDVAKAIALGADCVVIGTVELVALGCVRCGKCESGRGCPRGIASTDTVLAQKMELEWGAQRLVNLYSAWEKDLRRILQGLGLKSVADLVGRSDLLMHLDYTRST